MMEHWAAGESKSTSDIVAVNREMFKWAQPFLYIVYGEWMMILMLNR